MFVLIGLRDLLIFLGLVAIALFVLWLVVQNPATALVVLLLSLWHLSRKD